MEYRIKQDLERGTYGDDSFVDAMAPYRGRIIDLTQGEEEALANGRYIERFGWNWTREMLEHLEKPKDGQTVYVRDFIEDEWTEREFVYDRGPEHDGRYICSDGGIWSFTAWRLLSICPPMVVTREEIATKFGTTVDMLTIKD